MKKNLLSLIFLFAVVFYSCQDDSNSPQNPSNLPAEILAMYDSPPNVDDCYEGVLKMSEKQKALNRLNYFRQIHNLPLIEYNTTWDKGTQKSALISVANKTLSHFPPTTYKCYTPLGDTACQQSNLHISWSSNFSQPWNSELSIDGWINEEFSSSIGHRRWFLSPFLKTVSFGRVDWISTKGEYIVGTTMHVFDSQGPANTQIEFVACPFHDYPSTAFKPGLILSFTAIPDKSNWFAQANKSVDFSKANIQVTDESGNPLQVNDQTFDNINYGVPNSLEWRVNGLQFNKKYNVTISNAKVNGQFKEYTYWFKLNN